MEEFSAKIQSTIGLKLSEHELTRLHKKFCNSDGMQSLSLKIFLMAVTFIAAGDFDHKWFLNDLKATIKASQDPQISQQQKLFFIPENATLDAIISNIEARVLDKLKSMVLSGQNALYKTYQLLGLSKASTLTRLALKTLCASRLDLRMSDSNVETIFRKFDPENNGVIKSRLFLQTVVGHSGDGVSRSTEKLPYEHDTYNSASSEGRVGIRTFKQSQGQETNTRAGVGNMDATVTYSKQISGLVSQHREVAALGVPKTAEELEQMIGDEIFARGERVMAYHMACCFQLCVEESISSPHSPTE